MNPFGDGGFGFPMNPGNQMNPSDDGGDMSTADQ